MREAKAVRKALERVSYDDKYLDRFDCLGVQTFTEFRNLKI